MKIKSNQNYLLTLIKPVGLQNKKVIIIITIINLVFTSFRETFKTLEMESKYNSINKFYMALDECKKHKVITAKTKEYKIRVMNNVVRLYKNYFDFYEKVMMKVL